MNNDFYDIAMLYKKFEANHLKERHELDYGNVYEMLYDSGMLDRTRKGKYQIKVNHITTMKFAKLIVNYERKQSAKKELCNLLNAIHHKG